MSWPSHLTGTEVTMPELVELLRRTTAVIEEHWRPRAFSPADHAHEALLRDLHQMLREFPVDAARTALAKARGERT